MPYGMYLSAEGAQVQAQRMEVIANNLANVNTPGFKRDVVTFQARLAEAIEQGLDQEGSGSINDIGGGVDVAEVRTSLAPGVLKQTGIPTDMAIDGEGFFLVRKDNETYLTRAGNFKMTAAGQLVTQDDLPVLSDGGGPLFIDPAGGHWEIAMNGGISQNGAPTGLLGIAKPDAPEDLVKVGQNLFRSSSPTQPVPLAERSVRQNYLEGSGVHPTSEMMALIETSRAFEANTKLIQTQDQMLSSLVNRVLRKV